MDRRLRLLLVSACLVVALAGCAKAPARPQDRPRRQKVQVRLLIRGAVPETVQAFRKGDPVRLKDTGTEIGRIRTVEVTSSLVSVATSEGKVVAARSPQFKDVYLTIIGQATVSERGYDFGGEYVYVNNDVKYVTPLSVFGGIITSMRPDGG